MATNSVMMNYGLYDEDIYPCYAHTPYYCIPRIIVEISCILVHNTSCSAEIDDTVLVAHPGKIFPFLSLSEKALGKDDTASRSCP